MRRRRGEVNDRERGEDDREREGGRGRQSRTQGGCESLI